MRWTRNPVYGFCRIEGSNPSFSANKSMISTTYLNIVDFPHNFPPIDIILPFKIDLFLSLSFISQHFLINRDILGMNECIMQK